MVFRPRLLLIALVSWLTLLGSAQAAPMDIEAFHTNVHIATDTSFTVTEDIDVLFHEPRHGIFRDIPIDYTDRVGSPYRMYVSLESVTDAEGTPLPYVEERSGVFLRLRIGDGDTYVTGQKSYRIRYHVERAFTMQTTSNGASVVEFPWNVTGAWPATISQATATIHLPAAVAKDRVQSTCFTGYTGAKEKNCVITASGSSLQFSTTKSLWPSQELTYAIQIPAQYLDLPGFSQQLLWFLRDNYMVLYAMILGISIFVIWWIYGREFPASSVMPQWDLPQDIRFFDSVMLMRETVGARNIPAAIIDLATRGFLTIDMVRPKSFIFRKTRKDEALQPAEKLLLDGLFAKKDMVTSSDLRNSFYVHLSAISQAAAKRVVDQRWFYRDPASITAISVIAGVFLCGLGVMISLGTEQGWGLFSNLFVSLLWFIFSLHMPKKTRAGRRLEADIYGLREYILRAEQLRLSVKSAPKPSRQEFDRLLPYAMLFGLEARWIEQFSDLLQEPASWMEGSYRSFSSSSFIQSLATFESTSACPHTCTFNIDTKKKSLRIGACKRNGIGTCPCR